MLNILPILLAIMLAVILTSGALLVYRYTERNRLQKTLVVILILWALMFAGQGTDMIHIYDTPPLVGDIMNFQDIVLGLIGLFSLLSYLIVAIHPQLTSLRNSLLFLSPVLLLLLVYVVWHFATGTPMNYRYQTVAELRRHCWTFPVVLRALMLVSFCTYLFVMLRNVWTLVSICDKYSEEIYGDMACNVKWLRMAVMATGLICFSYLITLIWKSPVSEIFHTIIACVCLMMFIDNAVFHKVFRKPDDFRITWSWKKGWHEMPVNNNVANPTEASDNDLEAALEKWMYEEKPFYNSDFSFKDIAGKFPALDYHRFSAIMVHRRLTFQSYVRQCRIEEACRLIQSDPGMMIKVIALEVGFSHYTSFTRSFVAVTGESPSLYKERMILKNTPELG